MGRNALRRREGPSIREFLRYYVLALLQEQDMSAQDIRGTIGDESAENRNHRPSGQLLVGMRDLRLVLGQLGRRELIEELDGKWRLTVAGEDKLTSYEKQKEAQHQGKERAARTLLQLMGRPGPGQAVLDVGTGEGFLAFKVADRGYRVLGIDSGGFDYSKDSIQAAARKAGSRGGRVEFRQTSVASLRQMDESFDYVVTSQAIHCMKDQRQCLEAICRHLKPGGTFLCMDFLVGLEGFLHHGWHGFLALSREEWKELLPRCGFEQPHCHKAGDYLVVRARKPSRIEQES